jgi:HK97 family phage major capsid protein/HK97 family phage prohead protease
MSMERWPAEMEVEIREEGGAPVIVGYAAVFNSMSEDLGGFREVIAPGAFADSLGGDVRALWSHDQSIVLGRTKAGTLKIAEDRKGLRVEIRPPASAAGYVESIRRGDVSQMSFGFRVLEDGWTRAQDGTAVRTLMKVDLREVSPVAFPAYPASSVLVRELFGALPEIPESYRRAPVAESTQAARRAPAAAGAMETRARNEGHTMAMDKLAPVDMRRKAQSSLDRALQLDALATGEQRSMTADEQGEYDGAIEEHRRMSEAATRAETLGRLTNEDGGKDAPAGKDYSQRNVNVLGNRELQETRAHAAFIRTGDQRPLLQLRASNAVDMAEGAVATGGAAVPTGFYNNIIAKAGNYSLLDKLGLMKIPGKGKDVNVPVELAGSTVNPFVATNEKAAKDKDSPSLDTITMTLVKYTKVVPLTTELLEDEDANLLAFIENYVARAMADTYNTAIITAALKTTAKPGWAILPLTTPTAAPFVADLTQMYYGLREPYADKGKFVMRRATEGAYATIQGSPFVMQATPAGGPGNFFGAPVYNAVDVPALALSAKAAIFADWSYMGYREGASIGFLRDPYSRVLENVVQLIYEYRFVAQVLQPEAGVIGQKPAA